jgi:bacteriocin biosynthesis cyclodehydratase domain-containing protein
MARDAEVIHTLRAMLEDRNLRFPAKPRLIQDINVFRMPDGLGIQFRGAQAPVILRGRHAEAALAFLLPALDGTRTLDDFIVQCPSDVTQATLLKTLALLHTKGLLSSAGDEKPEPSDETMRRQLLFWGRKLGVTRNAGSQSEVQGRLAGSRLVLLGTGLFGAALYDILVRTGCINIDVLDWDDDGLLAEALANQPVPPQRLVHLAPTSVEEAARNLGPMTSECDLLLTATRNAPAELFRAVNRLCLEQNKPWLRANDDGTNVEIGPYIRPFRSACYTCMAMRLASAEDLAVEEHLYQQHLAEARPAGITSPRGEAIPAATLAASLVAMETVRILSGLAATSLLNAVLTMEPVTGVFRTNRFLRVPRCPECYRGPVPSPVEAQDRA